MTAEPNLQRLMNRVAKVFTNEFDRPPEHAAAAPGRVNLIGEHTDYNDGFVLPLAIDRRTLILAAINHSPRCRIVAADLDGEMSTFRLDDITPGRTQWANYVKGVFAQFLINGQMVPGIDAVIASDVPRGAGLSSSAALEMAVATLIEHLLHIQLDPRRKALWCQRAEHEFARVPCGIMDQFITAMAQAGHAMLIDCRSHDTRLVRLDDPAVRLVVADTNVQHEHAAGEYAARRRQCEQAAAALGIASLRDATLEQLEDARPRMDHTLYLRARHVIGENQRTLLAVEALDQRDYREAGALMLESHRSLRDDFQVSCPELDTLVELATHLPDAAVYGSRMTGGGFGGCTVTLVKTDAAEALIRHLQTGYAQRHGLQPACFTTPACDGASASTLTME